jgi:hypothetical protein
MTKMISLWLRVALVTLLILFAASCFLRYIEAAFAYSAIVGTSRVQETYLASHRAWLFLSIFLVLEVLSSVLLALSWEPPDFSSAWLRFVSRYGLALTLSLVATAIVVGLRVVFVR